MTAKPIQAEKETRFYIEVSEEDRTRFKIASLKRGYKKSKPAFNAAIEALEKLESWNGRKARP